ncbi:MAG: substrate-binding domain-containing protein [Gammaproteobacteria bacterium]
MKLSISPSWKFSTDQTGPIDPILFELLRHLQSDHKLTKAAEQANISYRHAWNILKKWNDQLGKPLVTQSKGQGTRLTELGEKFVWAEGLIDAHLTPSISTLASTINRELNSLLGENENILRIHASHGYAIDVIPRLEQDDSTIDIKYMGSAEAIDSLINKHCDIAGFHICTHPLIRKKIGNKHFRTLSKSKHTIIRMVLRKQGFIVQKNNPKSITHLSALTNPSIQFINRQKSAGTRILLDELLNCCGIEKSQINGYNTEEYTHTAIAAHVASGAADIGFGIEYAARKFNLDFIPIISEQYVLACKTDDLDKSTIKTLISNIKTHTFAEQICNLPGYELDSVGTLVNAKKFLNN